MAQLGIGRTTTSHNVHKPSPTFVQAKVKKALFCVVAPSSAVTFRVYDRFEQTCDPNATCPEVKKRGVWVVAGACT